MSSALNAPAINAADGVIPERGWRRVRHGLERLAVRGFAEVIPRLTRGGALRLARVLGQLGWLADRRGRATAIENLAAAMASDLSEAERRATARACYERVARTAVDLFWIPRLERDGGWSRWVRLDDRRGQPGPLSAMGPAIWVTPHYGAFEWLALYIGTHSVPFLVVAQEFKNPSLTPIFSGLRGRTGHAVTPRRGAMLRLVKHLRKGGHAALLTDLTVRPSSAATVIDCFGLKTCTTALHSLLAERMDAPVIPCYAEPNPDGTCTAVIERPVPTAGRSGREVAQDCWNVFENVIRRDPAGWLWMYKHWRYLPAADAESGRYPDYANRSKAFERLLEKE